MCIFKLICYIYYIFICLVCMLIPNIFNIEEDNIFLTLLYYIKNISSVLLVGY